MTETPVTTESGEVEEQAQPASPEVVKCAHCGKKHELAPGDNPDFLCSKCERYQDQATCPTCHSIVKASLMKGSS